jgi:ADP-dependent NAD(P)H-hydrate dehydratase / NAD(P)H-hydrate epimerase
MKIVRAAEMREIDRVTTERYGVASLTLMENAGAAVAEFCLEQYPDAQRIGVICGKGNNGGDGFVAARKLNEEGKSVSVLLLADVSEVKGDAAEMLKRLPVQPIIVRTEDDLKSDAAQSVFEADLLVDAILGTGFKPPVKGVYKAAIELLWGEVPVVSVDVPSGCDADAREINVEQSIWPEAIVSFTAAKPLLVFAANWLAPVAVAQIGSPEEAVVPALRLEVITPHPYKGVNTPRANDANKGYFGHVLVVGGSRGKAGAAAMAGMAALRTGAGLATVATPSGIQNVVSGFAPDLMTEGLAETDTGCISLRALQNERTEAMLKGKTVLAIGPGISRHPESAEFVRTLVHRREVPVVLDADGLNAFEGHDERLDGTAVPLVLTPHPGEMARLAGIPTSKVQADRIGVARKFAHDHNCIVVLKGWRTVVAESNGTVWINVTGNAAMAKGGTGDILTGIIAGAIAQYKNDVVRAVCDAVYLHGLAGDLGRDDVGEHSLLATDLLRYLPAAFADAEDLARNSPFEWINPALRVCGAGGTEHRAARRSEQ